MAAAGRIDRRQPCRFAGPPTTRRMAANSFVQGSSPRVKTLPCCYLTSSGGDSALNMIVVLLQALRLTVFSSGCWIKFPSSST